MSLVLTLVSLTSAMIALLFSVWAALERKRLKNHILKLESREESLSLILEDAGQMVDEMNRFSDYIVTQLDLKNKELWDSIKKFEEKMQKYSLNIKDLNSELDRINNKIECSSLLANKVYNNSKSRKVIPMNRRYSEALELAKNGMDVTEIAKKLNMGKGEIQLVLGLNQII